MSMPKTLTPAAPMVSPYSIAPEDLHMRGAELPYMTSVRMKELFPELGEALATDPASIREAAKAAIDKMDVSKIQPGDSVNLLASHHGFTIAGGEPYAEMLRTLRDEIERRTGTTDIRLRAGNGLRYRESEVFIKKFKLDEYFKGKVKNITPLSQGIKIDTSIGPLYGLQAAYDAKWIIHTHNSDVRELHFHRVIDRIMKPFGMSYARVETRSTYHYNLGPRGGNYVARAIFDSAFVQEKIVGAVMLEASPLGVIGIDADNDVLALNDRTTRNILEQYGKLLILLNELEDVGCITVLDCHAPIPYVSAGGLIFAAFLQIGIDSMDLTNPVTPYSFYSEQCYDEEGHTNVKEVPPISKAIKAIINNYACKGYPAGFFSAQVPSVIVGDKLKAVYAMDEQNASYVEDALIADNLPKAIENVRKMSGCDHVILFDGAVGGINVSRELREFLLERAPVVSRRVDEVYMAKWLAQRGMAK